MTNKNDKPNTKSKTTNADTPDMIAYTVQSRGADKTAIWTRIGAAWKHKDNKGYDVSCQALPTDGRLTLRFRDNAVHGITDDTQPGDPAPAVS